MLEIFLRWYRRKFTDPQVITLSISLLIGFIVVFFFHDILFSLFIAIVLAYLLEWPTQRLNKIGFSRVISVSIVLLSFITISLVIIFTVIPIVCQQGMNLLFDLPSMLNSFNQYLKRLPERYPLLLDADIVEMIANNLHIKLIKLGESIVKYSLTSLVNIIIVAVYLVIIPFMIFFLLKDKIKIINCLQNILPKNQLLVNKVWHEMNQQITNYARGKVLELSIVSICSYIAFVTLKLHYALFLSVLVGISVLIPYIGAVVVTVPVLLVAIFQWGIGSDFWTLFIIYLFIQGIDGNLLVPILFSEAVSMHPMIIILSIIIFGGIWGFWGVFFAIPLATLIKAVVHVWPEDNLKYEEKRNNY
uniref:AI-2E family transporter n=1 Tax=Candidatus Aschnera chinzeii TaxID=1485666 RepID=A0AAT9G5C5_9ENTR|nr:MAG: AI-2E family transporter [Candidatus Aschnera chinzeii]